MFTHVYKNMNYFQNFHPLPYLSVSSPPHPPYLDISGSALNLNAQGVLFASDDQFTRTVTSTVALIKHVCCRMILVTRKLISNENDKLIKLVYVVEP